MYAATACKDLYALYLHVYTIYLHLYIITYTHVYIYICTSANILYACVSISIDNMMCRALCMHSHGFFAGYGRGEDPGDSDHTTELPSSSMLASLSSRFCGFVGYAARVSAGSGGDRW